MLNAFGADSETQRKRLIGELKKIPFVKAIDAIDHSELYARPSSLYLATERLKELFSGVKHVFFVNNSHSCLQGENIREMLEACGVARNLQPIEVSVSPYKFTWDERLEMRRKAGCENSTRGESFKDQTLRGLDELLVLPPELSPDARKEKAKLLWETLADLESRRGSGVFTGRYSWFYQHPRSAEFDAAFGG